MPNLDAPQKTKGSSLLEVLISIVVLSIGLLGIASLQANALRYNHSAELRTTASYQAYNMLDRIRANRTGAKANAYDNLSGLPALPSCITCTSTQIATKDLSEWNTENNNLLPSGQGTVTRSNYVYTISIFWDNNRSNVTGLGCTGNEAVDLSCIQISGGL